MRFSIEFANPAGERRSIVAALSAEQCRSIDGIRNTGGDEQADLVAKCYALRSAYGEVPKGFSHTAPPTPVYLS